MRTQAVWVQSLCSNCAWCVLKFSLPTSLPFPQAHWASHLSLDCSHFHAFALRFPLPRLPSLPDSFYLALDSQLKCHLPCKTALDPVLPPPPCRIRQPPLCPQGTLYTPPLHAALGLGGGGLGVKGWLLPSCPIPGCRCVV